MSVISIIGPKGGIGKTTLSINMASALTKILSPKTPDNRVCLVDLDLRLPTITSLLDSHPPKTFYDLFETLENKTYQIDVLRNLYQILTWFQNFLEGEIEAHNFNLERSLALFKNLNTDFYRFYDFPFAEEWHELFLERGKIYTTADLRSCKSLIMRIQASEIKNVLRAHERNAWPTLEHYVNHIEEYGLSLIGGEVPILGKKNHRRRINQPEFLVLFMDFLGDLFKQFEHVILDTPAGGVNHLSSLMNAIDQILFVFDLSNNIAINGSIDALHSFIDYYEDFLRDFHNGRLVGLDKAFADRLVAQRGKEAVVESLESKKLGIVFNRFQEQKEIQACLDQMREYLDVLDKYGKYKNRIYIMGMIPYCKIINITNNRGVLFYAKDRDLSSKMDLIARNVVTGNRDCPTLSATNREIIQFLQKNGQTGVTEKLSQLGGRLQVNIPYEGDAVKNPQLGGLSFPRR